MTLKELNELERRAGYADELVKSLIEVRDSRVHKVFVEEKTSRFAPIRTIKVKGNANNSRPQISFDGKYYSSNESCKLSKAVLGCLYFDFDKLDLSIKQAEEEYKILKSQYDVAIKLLKVLRIN